MTKTVSERIDLESRSALDEAAALVDERWQVLQLAGMTPEKVEARITAPVEVEMLGIPDQVMLRSMAKYGLTDITVDFAEGTDIYWARQQVAERLRSIWGDLPPDVDGGIAPMATPLEEMFMFTVNGGGLDLTERRSLLDWVIRPALRTVPGVADVNSLGGFARSFEVVPNNARMNARGVSLIALPEGVTVDVFYDRGNLVDRAVHTVSKALGEAVLRAQIEGLEVGTVYEGTRRTPLLLRGAADLRSSPKDFENRA